MTERVRHLRERLASLFILVSEPVRADLEELLRLAEQGERASIEPARSSPAPKPGDATVDESSVAPTNGASTGGAASEATSLRQVLAEILETTNGPMRVRELTEAALVRGWVSASASPGNVVAACLHAKEEFVAVARGEYALRSAATSPAPPAIAADATSVAPAASSTDAPERGPLTGSSPQGKPPSLRVLLREILGAHGEPMRASELVEALVARGWTTTSPSPRDVVSAVLTAKPEFVAVARGVYALQGAPPPGQDGDAPRSESETVAPAPVAAASTAEPETTAAPQAPRASAPDMPGLPPGVLRRAAPSDVPDAPPAHVPPRASVRRPDPSVRVAFSPAVAEIGQELEFLLQHVADARADTAVLAPAFLRVQLTAWIARARAINDRARNHPEIVRATGRVAAELGDLCKRWWPGSVEAMKLDTQPDQALRPFTDEALDPQTLTWLTVADRLDAQLAAAWAEPDFDDGWKDTRWLCDDERFVADRLAEAEALLTRIGTPIDEPPLKRAIDLQLAPSDPPLLAQAARGLRWVRSVVTDGLRWGLLIGRLRWIAATHPGVSRSGLSQALAADYQPLSSGWGFDELLRREAKDRLLAELPELPASELPGWLTRAIDDFDNPELARLLGNRADDIASIDPNALGSRRARGRLRKLAAMLGLTIADAAPSTSAPTAPVPEVESAEPRSSAAEFASIRSSLLDRIGGNRALFISNREDGQLRDKLSATFGLDLEWCVAHPRRADGAAEAIRRGRYHVVLSATGFQDHTMDALFSRAAKDASTLYVRVNRGRPAACARAIARELGVREAG